MKAREAVRGSSFKVVRIGARPSSRCWRRKPLAHLSIPLILCALNNFSIWADNPSPVVLKVATFAGGGPDGVLATDATIRTPYGIAIDPLDNLYVASCLEQRVFRVDREGKIHVVAGNGHPGHGGEGGLAREAQLNCPQAVAVDSARNVLIADTNNHRVLRVDRQSGMIATIAGNGSVGFSGDDGPATSAALNRPSGLAFDGSGNLFVADTGNNRVRKVESDGVINTFAGGGAHDPGDGDLAVEAQLRAPARIATDASGNLYIPEVDGNRVRRVDAASGVITTVAGAGSVGSPGDGGLAVTAHIKPMGVRLDDWGTLFIADWSSRRIRRVDAVTGIITSVAGSGDLAFSGDGGPALLAGIAGPVDVAVGPSGDLYISDLVDWRVRRVAASSGLISTFAGQGVVNSVCNQGPAATGACLIQPSGIAFDAAGNVFLADAGAHQVIRIDGGTGAFTTVAGDGQQRFFGDGGPARNASLSTPTGVAIDPFGNLYVADQYNCRIRRVDGVTGHIATVAGNSHCDFSGDGGNASLASLAFPASIAIDGNGDLYIADTKNNRIRRVEMQSGVITTVAGGGDSRFGGDGIPATSAKLSFPEGVAISAEGEILIADTVDGRIRKVSRTTGLINTVARGNGPIRVAADSRGSVYFLDRTGLKQLVAGSTAVETIWAGDSSLIGLGVISNHEVLISDSQRRLVHHLTFDHPPVGRQAGDQALECSTTRSTTVLLDGSQSFDLDGDPLIHLWAGPFSEGGGETSGERVEVHIPVGRSRITHSVNDGFLDSTPSEIEIEVGVRVVGFERPMPSLGSAGQASGDPKTFEGGSNLPLKLSVTCRDRPVEDARFGPVRMAGFLKDDPPQFQSAPPVIVAGGGPELDRPSAVVADKWGNLYVATTRLSNYSCSSHERVVKVSPDGLLTVVAGDGSLGYSGDGGPATRAQLMGTAGLAIDKAGNVYLSTENGVRRVDASTGVITTVRGKEDGRDEILRGAGIAVDSEGNVYVASGEVKKWNPSTGEITTVAGGGTGDDGSPATMAALYAYGVAIGSNGDLYLAEPWGFRIRKVDSSTGIISTIAGDGSWGYPIEGGPAKSTPLLGPVSIVADARGNVYFSDINWTMQDDFSILRIDAATGILSKVGGGGWQGGQTLIGLGVDPAGNVFYPKYQVLRWDAATGATSTVATHRGGAPEDLSLRMVSSIVVDPAANVYFSEDAVFRIDALTGAVQRLPIPRSWLATDAKGNLLFSNANQVMRLDVATGNTTRIAGSGREGFSGDGGIATNAELDLLGESEYQDCDYCSGGIALDSKGNLYIADLGNRRVRRVDASSGIIETVAGGGTSTPKDGMSSTSIDFVPESISANDESLFIATGRGVLEVDLTTRVIRIVVGGAGPFGPADGVPPTKTWSNALFVSTDQMGNITFADNGGIFRLDRFSGVLRELGIVGWVYAAAVDNRGNIFVGEAFGGSQCDLGYGRVQRYTSGRTSIGIEEADFRTGSAALLGSEFKFTGGGTWSYNLSTKSLPEGSFQLVIEMPRGFRYWLNDNPEPLPAGTRHFNAPFILREKAKP